jgi:uncharacterized protein (TIGR03382 family)
MAQLGSLGIAVLALVAGLLVGPSSASACSGWPCWPGTFFPASGSVPANLKGIYWWPSEERFEDAGVDDVEHLRLARVDGATPELIDFTLEPISDGLAGRPGFLIIPETPFVEGASYVAWDFGCNNFSASEPPPPPPLDGSEDIYYPFLSDVQYSVSRFDVVAAAPLPSALGELVVSAQRDTEVWVYDSGLCTDTMDVIARDVVLELSASADPWADALFYRSVMDGKTFEPQGGAQVDPYPGTAMAGRGRELLYARCNAGGGGPGISLNRRRFELSAHIPGEDPQLTTAEVTVKLSCPSEAEPGGGCSTTGGSGSSGALFVSLALLWLKRRRFT